MVGRVIAATVALAAGLAAHALAGGTEPREVALIVELGGPGARAQQDFRTAARAAGLQVRERRAFSITIDALAVTVPEDQKDRLARLPGVAAVHPDRTVTTTLDVSVPLVGAPELWKLPVTGTGIDVAVIDTGVDRTHPALDGGTVVGGYDFANDDDNPMDDNGHGTHVAGIVAANGDLTGVAPGASIVAYKVLNRNGSGPTSDVLAGLEAAVDPANPHRAEVVNFSLGAPEPPDGPLTKAAQAAAEAGVVIVASAGNDGPAAQTVGAPGQAPGVLTVGASTSGMQVPEVRMVSPAAELRSSRWEYSANPPQAERELDVIDVGRGDIKDHDVAGKAVLLDAPGPPVQQALEAEKRGAVALLINGDGAGPQRAGSGDDGRFDSLVAVLLDEFSVTTLREALAAGPVRVGLSARDATDELAEFSSRGPTADFATKPDLVAPGVEIRSSVPAVLHAPGVARFSGTSMAAPHVAGAAALLRQLHPDWPASAVRSALAGASETVDEPPLLSGAGRLDIPAAADAAVVADTTAVSFGLAGTAEQVRRTRTLTLSNVGAAAADVHVKPRAASGPPVEVSPALLRLEPGEHRTLTVTLAADAPAEDVQGWVDLDVGGSAADVRVPYALPVRALHVVVSPDPADDRTEAFIRAPAELDAPPVVETRGPDGVLTRVTARHDHDRWWRATLSGRGEGVYRVRADARVGAAQLSGTTTFEVAEPDTDGAWEPAGPNSLGGQLDVGPGGRAYVIDSSRPVVWVSGDAARSWRARRITTVTDGAPAALAPDPGRPGVLYLALRSTPSEPTFQGQVLRSDDDGRTWTSLPAPDLVMRDLEVTAGGGVLAAATAGGLYAGADSGASWEPVAGPWSNVLATELVGDDLYAATDRGLFVVDGFAHGGRTPRRLDSSRHELVTGNARLLVASTGFEVRGSTDGGRTWTKLFTPPQGGRIWSLSVVGRTAYVGTSTEFWVGDRGGTRWQRRERPLPNLSVGDVRAHPSGTGLLVTAPAAGVFATTDGARTYERVGVPGVPTLDLAIAENAAGVPWLIAGTRFDTYRTPLERDGLEWGTNGNEGALDSHARVAVAPSRPQVVYKTVETPIAFFHVLRSEDGGETWRQIAEGNDQATALHVDPHDPDRAIVGYYAYKGNGVMLTENGGATWRKIRRDAPPSGFAADPRDGDRVWLADQNGLHASTDGGRTFARRHDRPLGAIALDPRDPARMIAGGSRLYVSEDGGTTLREAFYADVELAIADVVFDPVRPGVAYAAAACSYVSGLPRGGRGVLRTTDGGRTWSSFAQGLDDLCVRALAIAPDGRTLFAATARAGVQRIRP